MKLPVHTLKGIQLAWAVAMREGFTPEYRAGSLYRGHMPWAPDRNYIQCGPLMDKYELTTGPAFSPDFRDCYFAHHHRLKYDSKGEYPDDSDNYQEGDTRLIAACRCIVAEMAGDWIEIPDNIKEE